MNQKNKDKDKDTDKQNLLSKAEFRIRLMEYLASEHKPKYVRQGYRQRKANKQVVYKKV